MGCLDTQLLGATRSVDVQAKHASWVVQRVLKIADHLKEVGYNEDDIRNMDKYSIGRIYLQMRGPLKKVAWRSLVWTNIGAPKWLFILYLAVNKKLTTKVRLTTWGVITPPLCQLFYWRMKLWTTFSSNVLIQ